ncbi:hypothetical protein HYV50_04410 [Candidatus Pacearchaeota archaeon]|nr:hypothetical protein [Candidatus Pacearchaeota archaeon]
MVINDQQRAREETERAVRCVSANEQNLREKHGCEYISVVDEKVIDYEIEDRKRTFLGKIYFIYSNIYNQ